MRVLPLGTERIESVVSLDTNSGTIQRYQNVKMSSGKIHKHIDKNCHPDSRAIPPAGVDLPDHSGVVVKAVPRRQPPQNAVQKVLSRSLKILVVTLTKSADRQTDRQTCIKILQEWFTFLPIILVPLSHSDFLIFTLQTLLFICLLSPTLRKRAKNCLYKNVEHFNLEPEIKLTQRLCDHSKESARR